jgi:Trehalose utilisation
MIIRTRITRLALLVAGLAALSAGPATSRADDPWLVLKGGEGPGKGKHVVLVSGDEEYRSEEALTQLGKILAKRHGFDCTVLYAVDDKGVITPTRTDHIAGLKTLESADLMVILTRFRDLPDNEMKWIDDYVQSGRPIVGMRTATHAFNMKGDKAYARYSWTSKDWDGGFGRQVLGETWINHHGHHGVESTRGIAAPGAASHPILRGIHDGDIWGPTDVYAVRLPLPGDSAPIVLGQVLEGMKSTDKPVVGPKNDPMMPVAWTKSYTGRSGKAARIFTTTMGASQDLRSEGTRRMLVNACYWALGLEDKIPAQSDVAIVGPYDPLPFGFGKHKPGVKPADLAGD